MYLNMNIKILSERIFLHFFLVHFVLDVRKLKYVDKINIKQLRILGS